MLLIQDKKYDDLVKVVEKMHEKYPGNAKLIPLMYNIKKEVYKDKKAGLKLYDILIEQGDTKKD